MTIDHTLVIDGSKTTQAISRLMLAELGIDFDIATNESEVWRLMKSRDIPYDMVLVARASLGRDLRLFVSRLRALRHYASVPLILVISDKGERQDVKSLYADGFTQIFSRKEYDQLKQYIEQAQSRNTFEKAHQNKVIIIEDDLAQQLTVQAILEEKHCECFCFKSAEEALAQANNIHPHVITCDFFLEGKMTALDFVVQVKTPEHPWRHVPIIAMTGLDDPTRKYELVRSGANDYIAKPIDPLELSVHVENLIRYKHLLDTVDAQKKEMHYLAMHDQLTGLYNRHFIAEQVQISISEAKRHGIEYSMILFDIDFFKKVNDEHGHDIGDAVLTAVGAFLRANMRDEDIAARIGGEEFLILLSHCNLPAAVDKAEALRAALETLKPADLPITASFGVAQLGSDVNTFDLLFKQA
ncbi:MAG: diguanylate cyclase, partial [Pseudomonadota bacterium]